MAEVLKASQHLVDILQKNGFVDVTAKYDIDHAKRFQERGEYIPNAMKKYMAIPGRPYPYFKLDRSNIILSKKSGAFYSSLHLTDDQLRGFIAFCHLSKPDQSTLLKKGLKVPEIPERIERIRNSTEFPKGTYLNTATNHRLLEKWESIHL